MFEPGKLSHLLDAKRVELKPYTLDHLIAWLETMPADKTYCWEVAGNCLFHQYGAAQGMQPTAYSSIYSNTMRAVGIAIHGAGIASSEPHSFGVALLRARAYRASRQS